MPVADELADDPLEDAYYDYLLRIGDDALILGQRLSEWCGHAPSVEVDLSLANMALDLIGQATHILNQANNGDGDELAFKRDVLDSTWQHLLFQQLAESRDPFLSAIASKAVKEVAYHRELASEWTVRLGDGTDESAARMRDALDWCWRFVPELFEVDEALEEMIARQTVPDPRSFEREYRAAIGDVLAEAKLEMPADQRPILGGRRGHHSEHLGHLLAVMQYLPRTYPDAVW